LLKSFEIPDELSEMTLMLYDVVRESHIPSLDIDGTDFDSEELTSAKAVDRTYFIILVVLSTVSPNLSI